MRLFLRCWEFIIEAHTFTLAHYYLLDRARKGICIYCCAVYSRFSEYKLTLWSVCTLVDPEVKHIIYCHGWHSNTLHHKRISFHHNLFKTCIDTQVEGSIQNRHVCSSNFKYFSVSIVTSPITYVCYRNPTGDLTNFTYNQLNHLFSPNLFLLPFLFVFHFCLIIVISRHFSLQHNDNLKSIRVV